MVNAVCGGMRRGIVKWPLPSEKGTCSVIQCRSMGGAIRRLCTRMMEYKRDLGARYNDMAVGTMDCARSLHDFRA